MNYVHLYNIYVVQYIHLKHVKQYSKMSIFCCQYVDVS